MADFHENIFYGYRGAACQDGDRERQLEDNTTKALVNTLQHTSPNVSHHFLAALGITTAGDVRFALQRQSIGDGLVRSKKQRVLLGLVPPASASGAAPSISGLSASARDSRPDAWIWGEDFVVLVESKVVGDLDADQMARHFKKLTNGRVQPRTLAMTWAEVHGIFCVVTPQLEDRDKWLVRQFTQYLEWINMAGFVGFEKEIFDYFFTREDDETRKWVKATVSAFAEEVLVGLKKLSPFYEGVDVGTLKGKDDACWAAFGPPRTAYRKQAHQTFSVYADGIRVYVNIELKQATDKLKKLARQDRRRFEENVRALARKESFVVRVEERVARQASLYDYGLVANLESSYLLNSKVGPEGFAYFGKLLDAIPLPYVSFRALIPRREALNLCLQDKGASLVERVVSIMASFHPFVEYVNGA